MRKICVIGGEGIGVEVIESAKKILYELSLSNVEIIEAFAGQPAIDRVGIAFPEETKNLIDDSDAVLFGATGSKAHRTLIYLRFGLDNFANIRPVKLYKGLQTPLKGKEHINFVIFRENLEGLYSIIRLGEGEIKDLVKAGLLTEENWINLFRKSKGFYGLKIITEFESKRIATLACEETVRRKKLGFQGKLTVVHKANVMMKTDGLFKNTAYETAEKYIKSSQIIVDDYHVDDMAGKLVRNPENYDVLLMVNEYGDILSDMAAEFVGGLGLAPSACIGGKHPYFEPVHGSAPDIAGLGIANPLAAIMSLRMLLQYLNLKEADILERAIEQYFLQLEDISSNWKYITKDLVPISFQRQNKFAKTEDVTARMINLIHELS